MKTNKLALYLAVALGAAWLAGCSTPESRIEANPAVFARLTPPQQALVRAGQVAIGFDMDTVRLALGNPDHVTVRTDAAGQTQVWHYVTYMDNGVILYTGYYHGYYRHRHGGGWWGPAYPYYPYYLDYPYRTVYDRFRVEFRNGRVAAISQELPP